MKTLNVREIAKAVDGKIYGDEYMTITGGISTDSRNIEENSLFIPLRGDRFDGHEFIDSSYSKGSICVLSEKKVMVPKGKNLILVNDTKKALMDLAMYYLTLFNVKVVAITGSMGKTTTKDMVASVLGQKYNILKTEGNFNNEIGLPLTIFRLSNKHQIVILEMGMNSFGEIHNLSRVAKPDISVITNIGISHMENLGNREGILKAKCEIFDYMKSDGTVILNSDDDMLISIKDSIKFDLIWFGIDNKLGIYADTIVERGLFGVDCTIHTIKGDIKAKISVPGQHMILNAMTAVAVGIKLELSVLEIEKGIEMFLPSKMRMNIEVTKNNVSIINDAYNANPLSMKAALDILDYADGRKVAVLGDMFELGETEEELHYQVGQYAAQTKVNAIVCIGHISQKTAKGALDAGCKNVFYYESLEDFFQDGVDRIIKSGDTVLIKASRGMHFERTIEKIQEVE